MGWRSEPLGKLGRWIGGGTPSKAEPAYWSGGTIPWVSAKDMKTPRIGVTTDTITEEAVRKSAARKIPPGSVLCVMRSGILAHTFPVAVNSVEVTINQDLRALAVWDDVDPDYLAHFLRYSGKDILHACSKHGTTVSSIEASRLDRYDVPLPHIDTQRRIVARIDELFSELDDGEEVLRRARGELEIYRKALLKAAVTGELTADWRAANPPRERGADLLARILADRRARWDGEPRNGGKRYKEPAAESIGPEHRRRMWSIPQSWQWLQLGSFAFVTKLAGFEYTKFVSYSEHGDLPVIKAENAGRDGYRVTDYSRVHSSSVAGLTRSRLRGGELLMVFVGAGTGNVATVPSGQEFFLGPNIGMMRIETDAVVPRYVELFLRSPHGNGLALALAKAVAQPSLSMGTIRQIPVALPPLDEQLEILSRLEIYLGLTQQFASESDQQRLDAVTLRQSILAAAFRGELVQ